MLTPNIETFIACESSYEEAQTVLFGAPYDSTTSYRPGTRFASRAIRSESFGLETYSPYQDKDLEEIQVFDSGDLELSFGRVDLALADIKARTQTILADNKRPFMIGGEHLVTLPAVEATFEKYPDLQVIQFDAHTDLREAYLDAKLSHATVIRRIHDFLGDGKIHQFGIRSGERAEFQFAKEHTNLHKYNLDGLKETVAALKDTPVYLTIDLDVFDPGVFPGTGTPEAGGIFFMEFVESLKLISQLNIVALDVNELSPTLDQSGASTALACKVVRELLLAIH
ncbi:agmatinase [Enterococcus cecorum]|uniref:Agmatinase n=1 Tax=Enterococcus cecorum TaxID=44008 RepID=A0AAW8TMR1_9ENTE|nr:agmatinase [Enterococcus cecorum]MCJ0586713.1 agmatinase [Enterococcus cecorum]MCJ0592791.1 agmatinase [Enterococcus cecorum]MCJ0606092.1 agmatinase [Enterococcus cecorum]MDT2796333.1 agmatinase [Enterococcus cecorum]MDY2955095.1 agmatinase [Enterococcus cecorum]